MFDQMSHSDSRDVLIEVNGLRKMFPIREGFLRRTVGQVRAVDDVSFHIRSGETLSLVGESGCGKTTTSRCVVRAIKPNDGEISFRTKQGSVVDLATLSARDLRPLRSEIQMIFQDPFSSLNPRKTLLDIVGEPLKLNGVKDRDERGEVVAEMLRRVGIRPEFLRRYPHAFSGGQRQRIGIARALAVGPTLVVADEPVSALDVSVQAQTLNLLLELQEELGLTYLFVAHDLSVVKHISDRVAVMYVGQIVEMASTERLFSAPAHPYTEALMSAVPKPDPRLRSRSSAPPGDVADPSNPPSGCYFHPRCSYAVTLCREVMPELREIHPGQIVRCHRAEELSLRGVEVASSKARWSPVMMSVSSSGDTADEAWEIRSGARSLIHVGLAVADLDRMVDFYTRVLGLSVDGRVPHPRGGTIVFLSSAEGEVMEMIRYSDPRPPAERDPLRTGLQHCGFVVDDIEGEVSRLRGLGVEVGEAGSDATSGRVVEFYDPEDNRIQLTQRPHDATFEGDAVSSYEGI